MSTPAEIAAAVVVELNAINFGVAFSAVRANLPEIDLSDGVLRVVVSNVKDSPRRASRYILETTFVVDVCVAQRVGNFAASVDGLDELCGAIVRHFVALPRLPSTLTAIVTEAERWAFDAEKLRTSSEYVGIVRLTIKQDEAIEPRPPREE